MLWKSFRTQSCYVQYYRSLGLWCSHWHPFTIETLPLARTQGTGSMAFETIDLLWRNLNEHALWQRKNLQLSTVVICSPTLTVYFYVILATPTNSLAVPSPSLGVYQNSAWNEFLLTKFHDCFATLCSISSGSSENSSVSEPHTRNINVNEPHSINSSMSVWVSLTGDTKQPQSSPSHQRNRKS